MVVDGVNVRDMRVEENVMGALGHKRPASVMRFFVSQIARDDTAEAMDVAVVAGIVRVRGISAVMAVAYARRIARVPNAGMTGAGGVVESAVVSAGVPMRNACCRRSCGPSESDPAWSARTYPASRLDNGGDRSCILLQ